MTDLQKELLSIFIHFHRACELLSIKYFAFGGTALGGEREGGFIPWDDDMDFVMTREDYNIFLKEGKKVLPDYIFVQSIESDKYSHFPFIKLRDTRTTQVEIEYSNAKFNQGCWIDIFPLDEVTSDKNILVQFNNECKLMWKRIMLRYQGFLTRNPKKLLFNLKLLLRYPSWASTVKKVNCFNEAHFCPSGYYTFCWDARDKYLFKKELFSGTTTKKFEGVDMLFSEKNVEYLETQFGDWKILPPVNQRSSGHNCYVDLTTPFVFKKKKKYEKNN